MNSERKIHPCELNFTRAFPITHTYTFSTKRVCRRDLSYDSTYVRLGADSQKIGACPCVRSISANLTWTQTMYQWYGVLPTIAGKQQWKRYVPLAQPSGNERPA